MPEIRSTARIEAAIARPRFFFGSGSGSGSRSRGGRVPGGGMTGRDAGGRDGGPEGRIVPGPADCITAVPVGGGAVGGRIVVAGTCWPVAMAFSASAAWAAVGRWCGSLASRRISSGVRGPERIGGRVSPRATL